MTSKTDISVAKLVDMIKTGELTLPEMQRGYVWKADRVRDLLDSLYRGYPSGTILVWETDRSVPSRELAVSQGDSPFKGHKLLLDGQQRLTSLASILRGESVTVHSTKKPVEILFNLDHPEGPPTEEPEEERLDEQESDDDDDNDDDDDDELIAEAVSTSSPIQERTRNLAFAKASQALLASPSWIRVSDIFSDKPESEILRRALPGGWDNPNYAKYTERVQRVRRIRDYNYVMQVLERTMEYEEVAEIFVRVNSRGVKLRSSDLALAQITSRWRDSLRLLEGFREECGQMVDLGLVVRALVVFATGQSRFKSVGSLTRERLEEAWPKARRNVLWALEYLKSLHIDKNSLLSSPFLIITLAYHHEYHPRLVGNEARALRRWMLYANARGRYSRGSTETMLDADLTLIRTGHEPDALLEALQRQIGRIEFTPRDFVGTSPFNPILPIVFLALRAGGAVDLQSGTPLALPETGRARLDNWHYAFPKSSGGEVREHKEITNIVFLGTSKRGKKSVGAAEKWASKALEHHGVAALRAHGLPVEIELYKPAAFEAFLEYRRQQLADILNEYINGTQEGTLATERIVALLAEGESQRVEFKERAIDKDGKVLDYIGKEVAAFLNSDGGVLFIGVDDDGQTCGIEADVERLKVANQDQYQRNITNHLMSTLGKGHVASYRIKMMTYEAKRLCVIEMDRSPTSAYVEIKGKDKTAFYVRVGYQVQELVGKQIEDYRTRRG